ncbi:Mitochondrial import inner membrane translocase subunit TIM8 [Dendrobium catenatum]|uniref:Mitochondrial import inner membrane translocase subunit n=1 Tax=Dendrobium catenatum TaxID=906689 RepID=A0A2I0WE75_9ASPA|nr:Mitochondrial import inner membrane translocase subunit TIM8 [Dendrobium catenatum]
MISEMVGKVTNVCWDKCITGPHGSKFSSGETSYLNNCAQQYMDMSIIIMERFQSIL